MSYTPLSASLAAVAQAYANGGTGTFTAATQVGMAATLGSLACDTKGGFVATFKGHTVAGINGEVISLEINGSSLSMGVSGYYSIGRPATGDPDDIQAVAFSVGAGAPSLGVNGLNAAAGSQWLFEVTCENPESDLLLRQFTFMGWARSDPASGWVTFLNRVGYYFAAGEITDIGFSTNKANNATGSWSLRRI